MRGLDEILRGRVVAKRRKPGAMPMSRSEVMSRVRSKGSRPEMLVRRAAHALGYRFRLHRADLPGSPDLVFAGRRKVVFVHGCFWHGHDCKLGARLPKTRVDFWAGKIARNVERDVQAQARLDEQGWKTLVLWECELRDAASLAERLTEFLGPRVGAVTGEGGGDPMRTDSGANPE